MRGPATCDDDGGSGSEYSPGIVDEVGKWCNLHIRLGELKTHLVEPVGPATISRAGCFGLVAREPKEGVSDEFVRVVTLAVGKGKSGVQESRIGAEAEGFRVRQWAQSGGQG